MHVKVGTINRFSKVHRKNFLHYSFRFPRFWLRQRKAHAIAIAIGLTNSKNFSSEKHRHKGEKFQP